MARAEAQDIPPELEALYRKVLGPTRPVAYPGGHDAALLDAICKHYPSHLEPPHVPTDPQLLQRSYFKMACDCFADAPANERTAYWRLSLAGGLYYFNYYLERNIPRFTAGEVCTDIRRPLACSFQGDGPDPWGKIQAEFNFAGNVYWRAELQTDPAEFEDHYGYPTDAAFGLAHWTYLDYATPPIWAVSQWFPITPNQNGYWRGTPQLYYFGPTLRRAVFYRSAAAVAETVLWKFYCDEAPASYTYENWNPITP